MGTTYPTPKYSTDEVLFSAFPLGQAGMNSTDTPSQIGEGQVANAVNIIFERKVARTRPNLHGWGDLTWGPTASYAEVFSIQSETVGPQVQYLDQAIIQEQGTGTLWRLSLDNAQPANYLLTQIGTVALIQPDLPWANRNPMVEYNGVILIGNVASGMMRVDLNTGLTATQIQAVKPVYLSVHLSRVLAAYDLGVNSPKSARTVFWSAPGDETTWTGATSGAGSTVLDIGDYITGLCTINNMAVVCRSSGFTIGTATGQAFPPYNWQKWSDRGTGVTWPDTLAVHDNVMYFVGADNVYRCDLNSAPQPIGNDIKTEFMRGLGELSPFGRFIENVPVGNYIGYITRGVQGYTWAGDVSNRFKTYYNLFPNLFQTGVPYGGANYPVIPYHYKYSIEDGIWSKHDYNTPMCPMVFHDTGDVNTIITGLPTLACDAFLDSGNIAAGHLHIMAWAESIGPSGSTLIPNTCERPAWLTTRNHILGNLNRNSRVQRVLLRRHDTAPLPITVTLTAKYDNELTSGGTPVSIAHGPNNDGNWQRAWADVGRVIGQDFSLTINIPANCNFATDGYGFLWGDEGDFRG